MAYDAYSVNHTSYNEGQPPEVLREYIMRALNTSGPKALPKNMMGQLSKRIDEEVDQGGSVRVTIKLSGGTQVHEASMDNVILESAGAAWSCVVSNVAGY